MRRVLISLVALSLFAPALTARDKPAPTAPGTYKEWGQDIDQIEIVKTFKIADYDHIVVQTFDTSRMEALGWRPKMSSGEAVRRSIRETVELLG